MQWWEALVLGLVEGLTEYLPVSSTGHLLLAMRALGIPQGDAADAYAICIQGGAIAAVLGLYRARALEVCRGVLGRSPQGARLARNLVAAFLPAALVGLLLGGRIREHLFGLGPIALAWAVGGAAILFASRGGRDREGGAALEDLGLRQSLLVGVLQVLALWPGTSRSLVTILGGRLAGLSLRAAVEFSFLLGVVTLLAATGYEAWRGGAAMLEHFGPVALILGFAVAWASAVLSVRWLVTWLGRHGLAIFGWYRLALAGMVALCLALGLL